MTPINFLAENLVLILVIIAVRMIFGYMIKKGWMEKLTRRAYPSEEAVLGKSVESLGTAQEKDSIFKTDMFSFIGVQILFLVLVVFFIIIAIVSEGDSASVRFMYTIFIGVLDLVLLFSFIQQIFTCVTEIRIVQKGVEFKKFFPSKIITLSPEHVEKIAIIIGKDPCVIG